MASEYWPNFCISEGRDRAPVPAAVLDRSKDDNWRTFASLVEKNMITFIVDDIVQSAKQN